MTVMLVSSLLFALNGAFVKLTNRRVPVLEITIIRSSLALAASLVTCAIQGKPRPIYGQRKNYLLLFTRGLTGGWVRPHLVGEV